MKNEINRALVAKKKIFSLFAALTLSVGLWAETVNYLCPVYNDPDDVTKGIQKWETTTVEATAVTSSTAINAVTWGTAGQTTWFVVNGEDVQLSKGAICAGDVRLILADNAKLTAKGTTQNAGIQVSNGNSLTIYAQSTGTQMGQLIAECSTMVAQAAGIGGKYNGSGSNITINGGIITATGGKQGAAGIGGGYNGSGSNITINGGIITATGGQAGAAGIGGGNNGSGSNIIINGGNVTATGNGNAAGIGGGSGADGSNIIINGGTVTATGAANATGIGSGKSGAVSSNIFVATSLQVKADNNNPPTTVITNTGADLASSLAGQQYVVTSEIDIPSIKTAAIAAVNAAIAEGDNLYVKEIATHAVSFINEATNVEIIEALKTQALSNIASARAAYGEGVIAGYNTGHAAGEEAGIAVGIGIGYQQAQDELPTEGDCGPTVIITKGDKTLTLYNVDNVEYKVTECGGYK